jgi:DNA-binding transcriptional ArsR family regulator
MFDLTNFDISLFEASAGAAAKLLKALGNERRLMILCQLADGELSVGALQPRVGLSQSALSQHLAVLRDEGIVATRRDGQTIWYRIEDPAALRVVATLAEIFCPPQMRSPHGNPDAPGSG